MYQTLSIENCIEQRGALSIRLSIMTKNTSSPDKLGKHGTKKSYSSNECRLQYDNRKYIDRGKLFMLQINEELMVQGLDKMNCGKVGHPFTFC